MIAGIRIKVCGITRAADAAMCLSFGADYLGVNCWSGSPRHVPGARRAQLLREIPAERRVAVTVNPTADEAESLLSEGFAIVQAHFDPAGAECDPVLLSKRLGRQRLWLAPKLPDGAAWPAGLIPLASGFVHDAHAKNAFGGTGKQADWARFQQLITAHPEVLWILAGGLGPQNVQAAIEAKAAFLDLNSGVELAPGLKSAEKLSEVRQVLLKSRQS